MIKLGLTYTDQITGFKGVATGHVEYITGCNQTLLAPKVGKDGVKKDAEWFDDDRLKQSNSKRIILPLTSPGSDMAAPTR